MKPTVDTTSPPARPPARPDVPMDVPLNVQGRIAGVLAPVLIFSAAVNVLMLNGSLYMLQVYDRVLTSRSVPTLVGLFVIVLALYGFLGIFDHLRGRLLARKALGLDRQFGRTAFASATRGTDALRDLEIVRTGLSGPGVVCLLDLPFVPLFLGMLFLLHPLLGWLTVGGALISACLALLSHLVTARIQRQAAQARDAERQIVDGARRATETLAAMGMLGAMTRLWHGLHDRVLAAEQKGSDPAEALKVASKTFRMMLQSGILTLAAWLVIAGEISAGMIIASSVLSGRALAPIDQIVGQWRGLARMHEAYGRLQAMPGEADAASEFALPTPSGRLDVTGLTWSRDTVAGSMAGPARRRDPHATVLSDVSFALEPGDALGVIGSSASGKTTLARLLTGILEATDGDIRLDGADLGQWSTAARGTFIGYLPQSVEMLSGSVRDNIARFDPDARDADVIAVARLAGVHDLILSLPDGYRTKIGPTADAYRLSGGQLQRIALARAAYRMPSLVVLDEPNSNLDADGEAALNTMIRALRDAGRTVVVMAHRATALSQVNRILALEAGKVLAFGTKDEILSLVTPGATPNSAVRMPRRPETAQAGARTAPAIVSTLPVATHPSPASASLVALSSTHSASTHSASPRPTAARRATEATADDHTPGPARQEQSSQTRHRAYVKLHRRLRALRDDTGSGPVPDGLTGASDDCQRRPSVDQRRSA